jgi:hypothetical protein
MMKLGPELIGGGVNRFMDRKLASGFTAVTVRMRLRDICRLQADALMPKLKEDPRKKLCFINVAGGSASDSINTLILICKEKPDLLKNRKIEINVLDLDTFGPDFAGRCIDALKAPGRFFYGLDVTFKHVPYDWSDTAKLADLLLERRDWLIVYTSEGGLFEYGTDEDIARNLIALDNSSVNLVVGDLVLGMDAVNHAFPAMLESTGNQIRFLGKEGLEKILKTTNWTLDKTVEGNPCYLVFTLKRG